MTLSLKLGLNLTKFTQPENLEAINKLIEIAVDKVSIILEIRNRYALTKFIHSPSPLFDYNLHYYFHKFNIPFFVLNLSSYARVPE
jgi:hypothetical protein